MKSITVTIYEIGTSRMMKETFTISENQKEDIMKRKDALYSSCPFDRKYYDVESQDSFTESEINMLADLDLIPTNRLITD
jgi:hypothetical protein